MIAVVQRLPGAAPCVAKFTRRVALHVGVLTWCEKEVDAGSGVYQVPDSMKVCGACTTAIKNFEAQA